MSLPHATGGGGANWQNSQPSLPALPAHLQSDTNITAHLASRFHAGLPTARLSSHALISLNTHTNPAKGVDGTTQGSALAGTDDIADRAWLRLGYRAENQSVLFLGESGSGKSTLRNNFLTAILNKSNTSLSHKVSLAAYVFDTLTTTKTDSTPTASKAGLFYELQYDTSVSTQPALLGGKLLSHRLERSRIADVPNGERNFHILYYLLAGTTPAEKAHLGFDVAPAQNRWRYLGQPSQLKVGINDADGFTVFQDALKRLEFPRTDVAEICQILATILHLGQLEFETTANTSATGDDSGGFSHEGATLSTNVKNKDVLNIIAAFLGVNAQDLQNTLGLKTKMIHKERVTVLLDPKGAREHANELARTLYSLLVAYIIESVNQRICAPDETISNTLSVVDFPGFSQTSTTGSTLDQLLTNAATESIYHLTLNNFFDRKAEMLESEEVTVAATSYFDNSDAVRGLLKPGNGLLSILDDQSRRNRTDLQLLESIRKRFEGKNPAIVANSGTTRLPGSNFWTENAAATFTVKHYAGEVDYPVKGLIEENSEVISGDILSLIGDTRSSFVAQLFGQEALQTIGHPQQRSTLMQATISSKPTRAPSVMSRKGRPTRPLRHERFTMNLDTIDTQSEVSDSTKTNVVRGADANASSTGAGASGQVLAALENVTKAVTDLGTNSYFVFCLKPNDRRVAHQFDSKCVRSQVQTLGIAEISQRLRSADFSLFIPFGEFLGLADTGAMLMGSERERAEVVVEQKQWPPNEVRVGATGVFLSERCWMDLTQLSDALSALGAGHSDMGDGVDGGFAASKERLISTGSTPLVYGEKGGRGGYFGAGAPDDSRSEFGAGGDLFKNMDTREQMVEKTNEKDMQEVEKFRDSPSRRRWVFVVYLLTWFVPDFLIRKMGRMPRKDIRMAWREKLAINFLIWFFCGIAAFFIIVFPMIICPRQHVYSPAELSSFNGDKGSKGAYVAIRGYVFDLEEFAPHHYPNAKVIASKRLMNYAGLDASSLFPVQVSALCRGKDGSVDEHVSLDYKQKNVTGTASVIANEDLNFQYHDFRSWTNDSRPDWYFEQMSVLRGSFKKGNLAYSAKYVKKLAESEHMNIGIIGGNVYDLSRYVAGGLTLQAKAGEKPPDDISLTQFMDQSVVDLFAGRAGEDLTEFYEGLSLSADQRSRMTQCLDNLFLVGVVDTRNSTKCQFAEYLVLAVSILLCSILGFKFLAALQFGTKTMPENIDKFIMCQIPAYTEDEDSLRRAIDSAARMKYDDKRKLLVVVCDGMIIGQGNDRPTPRIVLDILGVPESVDPEPLSFEALGEGLKQHNMGKVYSGLYEVQGHIVPFLVVVKVGKPSEVSRPGNRGKRDSQMVMMRFLNRVHYNLAMNPLELEMYHQIRNIIGVNPTFYEFMLQIDADTVVAPDSATRMVASFLNDTRLIAVCGETALTNSRSSFITMIQVYEYFISHNLTKAFESLFGSVTCLPGCFSMYRIRAAETGKPLFVSKEIIEGYATIRVDTLHMKNLLHLGEDRFLTTLLLKFHAKYKTKFISSAQCWTIAPDSWQVFLSQRRRWINSTVHNLIELIPLNQLCGFCCFSMRFIVIVDLVSTIVQPFTIVYIGYLIYLLVDDPSVVPTTAFIMLAAIYGLQAVIFMVRRKWEMIGWMILYILAIPVFSFGLPLYSFWNMDDFNWGNTRVVAGERGTKVVISDEGKFDPASIPRKKWEEYQAELWEAQTSRGDDTHSEVSGFSYATKVAPGGLGSTMNVGGAGFMGGVGGGMNEHYGYPMAAGGGGSRPGSFVGVNAAGSTYAPMERNMSRMSLLPPSGSEMNLAATANRASQYGGSQIFTPEDMVGLPSDDAILAEIRDILRTADLMTVTKKGVKQELERRFDVPLDAKKAYINSATEALVSGQM